MRCVLAIVANRNLQVSEVMYELSEKDIVEQIVAELGKTVATTWWQRLKYVFQPPAAPDFRVAIYKIIQQFKDKTIAAHHGTPIDKRPFIDWKFIDRLGRK